MALRVNRPLRVAGWIAAAVLTAAIGYAVGNGSLLRPGTQTTEGATGGLPPVATAPEAQRGVGGQLEPSYDTALTDEAAQKAAESGGDALVRGPMVIKNASLEMRVDDVERAIAAIRKAASESGATIEQLTVSGGKGEPRPLTGSEAVYPTPASASVTLRVDARRLETLSRTIAKSGTVLSQSSSSDDVTQQYVDMAARLKNLKAEEARLRGFFTKAAKVSDLLAVERELARVRGEIESMQAQVDYLKRQVARATLTVTLTEPGPVIQPSGTDWGFVEALRRGVQGAASVITSLITVIIALAPLAVLALLVWLVVRWSLRRRRATRSTAAASADSVEQVEKGGS